jgi:hypothetical protein
MQLNSAASPRQLVNSNAMALQWRCRQTTTMKAVVVSCGCFDQPRAAWQPFPFRGWADRPFQTLDHVFLMLFPAMI